MSAAHSFNMGLRTPRRRSKEVSCRGDQSRFSRLNVARRRRLTISDFSVLFQARQCPEAAFLLKGAPRQGWIPSPRGAGDRRSPRSVSAQDRPRQRFPCRAGAPRSPCARRAAPQYVGSAIEGLRDEIANGVVDFRARLLARFRLLRAKSWQIEIARALRDEGSLSDFGLHAVSRHHGAGHFGRALADRRRRRWSLREKPRFPPPFRRAALSCG